MHRADVVDTPTSGRLRLPGGGPVPRAVASRPVSRFKAKRPALTGTSIIEMDYPDELLCLFTAQVEERNGSYVVEVPEREVSLGDLRSDGVYRVALLSEVETDGESTTRQVSEPDDGPQEPPVDEGERRTVEIEDIGDQGDGVARVERGYVIIVPDTDLNERVTVRITEVRENLAFGEVIKRHDHVE